MKRCCFITIFFISSVCLAQKPAITYLGADGRPTKIRDSAVLIRTISSLIPGTNLYPFKENFITGEVFRAGKTSKTNEVALDGDCTMFYPSGKRLFHAVYTQGKVQTDTTFFPNGTVFLVNKYIYHIPDSSKLSRYTTERLITACNDSTGKALITDGNGLFVNYQPQINKSLLPNTPHRAYYNGYNTLNEEGSVKNGQKDGAWNANEPGSTYAYTEEYRYGKLLMGESTDKTGKKYKYTVKEASASFPGGIKAFYDYLGKTMRYPSRARELRVQGKVYITFIVEKSGKITGIRVLKSVNDDMSAEAVRVIQVSPDWVPGQQNGIPVRQQYTVPISFALMN